MNDDLNKKEKTIKSILEKASWQTDTDDIWAKLENKLPSEKRKRRAIPIWWFAGTLFFVLISLCVGYNIAKVEANTLVTKTESTDQKNDNSPLSLEKLNNNQIESVSSSNEIKSSRTVIKNPVLTKNNFNDSKLEKEDNSKASYQTKEKTGQQKEQHKSNSIYDQNIVKTKPALVFKKPLVSEAKSIKTKTNIFPKLDQLESLQRSGIQYNYLPLNNNPNIVNVTTIKPLQKKQPIIFFRARGGVTKTYFDITDIKSNGEFDSNIFKYEKGKTSLSTALDIGTWWKSMKIFGGLSYSQSVVQYGRNDTGLSTTSGTGVETILIDENGNSQSIIGTTTTYIETQHNLQWHRRNQQVDFHIGMEKSLFTAGQFSFGIDALVGYNLKSSHSGYYFLDAEDSFQKFVPNENHIYKNKSGFHAAIMGQLSFHLRNIDISLIPVWRKDLSSITNTDNFYQIKNSQLGLQLGISYTPSWK